MNETDLMTNYNSIVDKTQIIDCLLLLIDCLLLSNYCLLLFIDCLLLSNYCLLLFIDCLLLLLVILLTNLKYSCSVTVFICVSMCIIYMSPLYYI